MPHYWLRGETKPNERRTPLTPGDAKTLIAAGHKVTVERWENRCFHDDEYEAAGCELATYWTWESAPADAVILGLKELPGSGGDPVDKTCEATPLRHKYIQFAHCFKKQTGWVENFRRYKDGGGQLYDLEFLVDPSGRRKVAFGRSAGFCGMGLGILAWAHQQEKGHAAGPMTAEALPPPLCFPSRDAFVQAAKDAVARAGRRPRVKIMGSLGRCGSGAAEMAELAGVAEGLVGWDLFCPKSADRIKAGGPFEEILDVDIFVNCINLNPKSEDPPFLTQACLEKQRNLSCIVDVSCDPNNPKNPLPIYKVPESTSFDNPVMRVLEGERPVDLVAIDHLPSLVPAESSSEFSAGLSPLLADFHGDEEGVWKRAMEFFDSGMQEALAAE
eukprot:Hpha_TRINITY_DN16296_c2_g12::TRINITY_DN16296_c2_g12_i1::g.11374::m.11374/K00290/LYS1; saccharopine dehydrogenase (NAD+, L-lysine forming)